MLCAWVSRVQAHGPSPFTYVLLPPKSVAIHLRPPSPGLQEASETACELQAEARRLKHALECARSELNVSSGSEARCLGQQAMSRCAEGCERKLESSGDSSN